jgi:hypothetical protein
MLMNCIENQNLNVLRSREQVIDRVCRDACVVRHPNAFVLIIHTVTVTLTLVQYRPNGKRDFTT